MQTFIRLMCAGYSVLLLLYARRLRDAYGQEMVAFLREQMLETLDREGPAGPLRPAGRALYELVTVALPSRLNTEGAAIFSLAVCGSFGILFALCQVVLDQDILDPWMRSLGLQCR
jgi:hypothetical protein